MNNEIMVNYKTAKIIPVTILIDRDLAVLEKKYNRDAFIISFCPVLLCSIIGLFFSLGAGYICSFSQKDNIYWIVLAILLPFIIVGCMSGLFVLIMCKKSHNKNIMDINSLRNIFRDDPNIEDKMKKYIGDCEEAHIELEKGLIEFPANFYSQDVYDDHIYIQIDPKLYKVYASFRGNEMMCIKQIELLL